MWVNFGVWGVLSKSLTWNSDKKITPWCTYKGEIFKLVRLNSRALAQADSCVKWNFKANFFSTFWLDVVFLTLYNKGFLKQARNPGTVEKSIANSGGRTDGTDGFEWIEGTDGTDETDGTDGIDKM